jgi:hypothetical protein
VETPSTKAYATGKGGDMSERLLHEYRVYLTRDREYHLESHVCRGVRERSTGEWLESHWSIGRHLTTAFADCAGRLFSIRPPVVGERLSFRLNGEEQSTTAVLAVERLPPYCDVTRGLGRMPPALRDQLLRGIPDPILEAG